MIIVQSTPGKISSDKWKENRSVGQKFLNLHCLQSENVKTGKNIYGDNDSQIAWQLLNSFGEDNK